MTMQDDFDRLDAAWGQCKAQLIAAVRKDRTPLVLIGAIWLTFLGLAILSRMLP